jgi:hypothetical protein
MLHEDMIINMEPALAEDSSRQEGWHYLVGIDKFTGKKRWTSEDALTHYNTPFYNKTKDGRAAILIGRGGPHRVPESPAGYSLVDINNGKSIWVYEAKQPDWTLYNSAWNQHKAVWITKSNSIVVLDSTTGQEIRTISLVDDIILRSYNIQKINYDTFKGDYKQIENHNIYPAWYSNIIVGDELYFLCFGSGYSYKNTGAEHCLARVNLSTGRVEYLELPVRVTHEDGKKKLIWGQTLSTETTNSRGLDTAFDKRSKRDGWIWNFNPNPILVNDTLYFTLMGGISYSIRTGTKDLNEQALISANDLGEAGQTWSMTTPSVVGSKLYQRTLKEVFCIKKPSFTSP